VVEARCPVEPEEVPPILGEEVLRLGDLAGQSVCGVPLPLPQKGSRTDPLLTGGGRGTCGSEGGGEGGDGLEWVVGRSIAPGEQQTGCSSSSGGVSRKSSGSIARKSRVDGVSGISRVDRVGCCRWSTIGCEGEGGGLPSRCAPAPSREKMSCRPHPVERGAGARLLCGPGEGGAGARRLGGSSSGGNLLAPLAGGAREGGPLAGGARKGGPLASGARKGCGSSREPAGGSSRKGDGGARQRRRGRDLGLGGGVGDGGK
jgi:hypothetical protein